MRSSDDPLIHGVWVNDMQSRLNRTQVLRVEQPASIEEVAGLVRSARREGLAICVAGGRHAMGGQQFAQGALLLDTTRLSRVVQFDRAKGHIEVEAGIHWPQLVAFLDECQKHEPRPWAIRQKQTGVDEVSLGGSLSANAHGRGLRFPPLVDDVESFVLVDADGEFLICSRQENTDLFSLAIGGYGLFGVIVQITLRLIPRVKVRRWVQSIRIKDLAPMVASRMAEGFLYGDCQYAISMDGSAEDHPGVFSCYEPVSNDEPVSENPRRLAAEEWASLYRLARRDKRAAFALYTAHYQATSGQIYWSDTHQLAPTFDGYKLAVDEADGTEMITEVYVPRTALTSFLAAVRQDAVTMEFDVTYGTIRWIEPDTETFLVWAREPFACVVCNLHVRRGEAGIAKAAGDFRAIIDRAISFRGSYFPTYHRWANRSQVEACHPRMPEFLRLKLRRDPAELFQSEWYRHYRRMFADCVG